ncbi:MAG: hypothetical protein IKW48_07910 [Akkermansia sp.]|nr:hypothetical protein [Akkermansia sp.]
MKFFPILLICAAVVAFSPAQAQGRRSNKRANKPAPAAAPTAPTAPGAAEAEAEAPKTGVRFVVCSPAGVPMPSPLYVRRGKGFKAISISSRTPSERVLPVGGNIDFWDKDPSAAVEGGKKPAAGAAKLPEPIFTIPVPAGIGGKSVCIFSPKKDGKKPGTLFLDEKDFPRKGMHIINLSSYPLQIVTSESSDFKDKKESKIGVFRSEDGISASNSWSFKGEKGQQVSFILSYADQKTKTYKRIKSSTFVLSDRQSVLNVVVKDQTRNMPMLMTIQLPETK